MILSVSRKTDIPTFHFDWFLERIREGYVMNRNPMYPDQVYKTPINPETCDCIVFWTKNAIPALPKLDALQDYKYYFQYTLTGYDKDVEAGLPDKNALIQNFRALSDKIGPMRVVWRYDPILFSDKYTPQWHIEKFREIAGKLKGKTEKCVISFIDPFYNSQMVLTQLGVYSLSTEELTKFAKTIADIAHENGMTVATCAEKIDLQACGIEHNSCIDKELIERIIEKPLSVGSDKGQREDCGCVQSIDIGTYDTCKNGCAYCYACKSQEKVTENILSRDNHSPLLCDTLKPTDNVMERKPKSFVSKKWLKEQAKLAETIEKE